MYLQTLLSINNLQKLKYASNIMKQENNKKKIQHNINWPPFFKFTVKQETLHPFCFIEKTVENRTKLVQNYKHYNIYITSTYLYKLYIIFSMTVQQIFKYKCH